MRSSISRLAAESKSTLPSRSQRKLTSEAMHLLADVVGDGLCLADHVVGDFSFWNRPSIDHQPSAFYRDGLKAAVSLLALRAKSRHGRLWYGIVFGERSIPIAEIGRAMIGEAEAIANRSAY